MQTGPEKLSPHTEIINLMKILGYKSNKEGICFGLTNMASQAILLKQMDTFSNRMNNIHLLYEHLNLPPLEWDESGKEFIRVEEIDRAKKEIEHLIKLARSERNALRRSFEKRYQEDNGRKPTHEEIERYCQDNLAESTTVYLDMLPFFDGIELYFQPDKYKHLLPESDQDVLQNPIVSSQLINSISMDAAGGLAFIDDSCHIFDYHDLNAYFELLLIETIGIKEPLSIILSGNKHGRHAINISYDGEKWYFVDANQLPPEEVEDPSNIAMRILVAFGIGSIKTPLFMTTQIYTTKENELEVRKMMSRLERNDEFRYIHDLMTADKVEYTDDSQSTFLHYLVTIDPTPSRIQKAKSLLENQAKVDAKNNANETPLILAIRCKNMPMVELLVNYGADINYTNNKYPNLVWMALLRGAYDITKLLLARGTIIDGYARTDFTPLMVAAKYGFSNVIGDWLKQDDVNVKNQFGWTALLIAAYEKQNTVVDTLLKSDRIDVNAQLEDGRTALIIAIDSGNLELAERLISDNRVNVNIGPFGSPPPLGRALYYGSEQLVRCLLQRKDLEVPKEVLQWFPQQNPNIVSMIENRLNERRKPPVTHYRDHKENFSPPLNVQEVGTEEQIVEPNSVKKLDI